MHHRKSSANNLRQTLSVKLFVGLFIGLLLTAAAMSAAAQSTGDQTTVRDLMRKARKSSRAETQPAAEKLLRQALAMEPNRSDIKIELAQVLAKQRKLYEAYTLVFGVCEAEPKNARAFSVLGNVLLVAGRFPEARPVLYTALKLDRGQDLAWYGLGMLEFYENNVELALVDLEEAIYRNGDEPDFWFAYAQVSARAEKYKQAADGYAQFLNFSSSTDVERRARINGLIQFLRYIGLNDRLYSSVGDQQAKVGFELVGNRPIIKLKVNKYQEPLRFVLDTGSGITVISDETAKRLNINAINRGGFAKGIGGDGKFEIVYGFLQSISIGDVKIRDVPVYIRKFHSDQKSVDGYIGLAVISKFLATIDYGDNTFSLMKKDAPRSATESSPLSLPLRLTSSGFLSGQVQIEGIAANLNFIVDTGASVSVISDRMAANEAISPFVGVDRLRVVGSAGVTEDVPTFMLPKVTFGPHSRTKIAAIALDLDLINEATGFEQAGILGGNFLKNYRLTFDFKNSKVNFTPITPDND